MSDATTMTLYRPVGQRELELIRESGWRRFPPRLEWQPIFYPVLTDEYASRIAREWNTKDPNSGFVGYVVRFEIDANYVARFAIQEVGGRDCRELWVPAEQLEEFNDRLVGPIELVHEFRMVE
jgi:hypothetical protein